MRSHSNIAPFVLIVALAVLGAGCPALEGSRCNCIDLADAIVGTWELHQGGTITFSANGTFETSEATEGEYQIVNQSVLLDIESVEGELNQVLTCLGELQDGRLLFSQETPIGMSRMQ